VQHTAIHTLSYTPGCLYVHTICATHCNTHSLTHAHEQAYTQGGASGFLYVQVEIEAHHWCNTLQYTLFLSHTHTHAHTYTHTHRVPQRDVCTCKSKLRHTSFSNARATIFTSRSPFLILKPCWVIVSWSPL